MTEEMPPINLIKSGFGIGGASLADVGLLSHLRDRGHEISILTGYVSPEVRDEIIAAQIPLRVDSRLDHERHETGATIREAVLGHLAINGGTALFSQALSVKEASLGQAAIDIARVYPSIYRQHNHLAPILEESYASAAGKLLLSVTEIDTNRFWQRNPNISTRTLPPLIDIARFTYSSERAATTRQTVRQMLRLTADSIVIFQPTRVSQTKGIEYTLGMAAALQKNLEEDITVVIAGGNEPIAGIEQYKQSLIDYGEKLGFRRLQFLGGKYAHAGARRTADVMIASDIIAFPSYHESFGLGIAEASLCKKPVFTRAFEDTLGAPVFEEVYGNFEVVKDSLDHELPSEESIKRAVRMMRKPQVYAEMVAGNYERAKKYTYDSGSYRTVLELIK